MVYGAVVMICVFIRNMGRSYVAPRSWSSADNGRYSHAESYCRTRVGVRFSSNSDGGLPLISQIFGFRLFNAWLEELLS